MYPQTHYLFPFLIGLIFYQTDILSWKLALLAGIVGVIIDLDHYVEHIFRAKKNRFSLKATWNNSIKLHKFNQRSFIHYWDGALIITFLLGILIFLNWHIALALAIGYYSHILLDIPHFAKKTIIKLKIGELYFRESWVEIVFDIILFLGCIFTVFL